jgi:hypothetical protein
MVIRLMLKDPRRHSLIKMDTAWNLGSEEIIPEMG